MQIEGFRRDRQTAGSVWNENESEEEEEEEEEAWNQTAMEMGWDGGGRRRMSADRARFEADDGQKG